MRQRGENLVAVANGIGAQPEPPEQPHGHHLVYFVVFGDQNAGLELSWGEAGLRRIAGTKCGAAGGGLRAQEICKYAAKLAVTNRLCQEANVGVGLRDTFATARF